MKRLFMLLALALIPGTAQATWKEATSRNFVLYSEASEESLRNTVSDLEKYWFMLHFISGAKPSKTAPKIKIYMMANMDAVQATMPYGGGAAGYYTATPRGPIAVGIRQSTGGKHGLSAQTVLFHELAHHFMLQYFPAAYPVWYVEGFADYYGTARILDKDVIEVGHGLANRYLSFVDNEWIPLEKLLAARSYSDVNDIHLLYSQGWMLVHYLANNSARRGQLQRYLDAINAGTSYEQARDQAFGPGAKELNAELRSYSRRRRIMALSLPFKPIDVGAITVRVMSAAEDGLVKHDIMIGSGLPRSFARKFADEVRPIAGRFPGDPFAVKILLEAERAAGNRAAATALAERWLALEPDAPQALMHKAELQIEALREARSSDTAAWDAARKMILAANKKAPGDPQILVAYYNSFTSAGLLPPPGAQNALFAAFERVPQDEKLRHMVAADFEARDMITAAIAVIKPVALELHDGEQSGRQKAKADALAVKYREVGDNRVETAREMLARLEKKLAEAGGKDPVALADK